MATGEIDRSHRGTVVKGIPADGRWILSRRMDDRVPTSSLPASVPLIEGPFASLAIALLLGLLVGMQRERTNSRIAGVRTFALITLLGAGSALAAGYLGAGAWLVPAAFLGLAAMLVAANLPGRGGEPQDPGITTEAAALVMFCVGAMLGAGQREIPAAIGGSVAILLQLKQGLHGFVNRLGDRDVRAIMQFALVSAVILPVVPDRVMGPYSVLNPHQIWLMVVLIVGVSLGAYIAYKFLRARSGNLLAGLLGGLISSTATTVSFARRTREAPDTAPAAVLVIVIASAVVYARVLVLTSVAAPASFRAVGTPVAFMLLVMVALAAAVWRRTGDGSPAMPEQENPSDLRPALMFGAIYAAALLAAAAARDWFGDRGLYTVATIAGLVDMDAITLSTSRLTQSGTLDPAQAWRAIVLASMSNMVFKGAAAWVIGGSRLGKRLAVVFGIAIAAGLALMWLW